MAASGASRSSSCHAPRECRASRASLSLPPEGPSADRRRFPASRARPGMGKPGCASASTAWPGRWTARPELRCRSSPCSPRTARRSSRSDAPRPTPTAGPQACSPPPPSSPPSLHPLAGRSLRHSWGGPVSGPEVLDCRLLPKPGEALGRQRGSSGAGGAGAGLKMPEPDQPAAPLRAAAR